MLDGSISEMERRGQAFLFNAFVTSLAVTFSGDIGIRIMSRVLQRRIASCGCTDRVGRIERNETPTEKVEISMKATEEATTKAFKCQGSAERAMACLCI